MTTNRVDGYAGRILRIDLSTGQVSGETLSEATLRKYVGGTGIGAKYLYDEVSPGVEWSDPENRLMLTSGPLGGTRIMGSGTFSVVSKGPLTNGAVATQSNGFFGAYLKFAGYDGIVIQGAARRPLYLYIHDGMAELRDAAHLLGKDTWETPESICQELGQTERSMSVASIGPAGERLVKYASIFVDKGHTASHNGVGAVMGSKNLKAIAVVRARRRPHLNDSQRLSAIAQEFLDNIVNDPVASQGVYRWGTLTGVVRGASPGATGFLPVKNYTTSVFEIEPDKLERFGGPYIRSHFKPKPCPCWACRMHHCHIITITEGPYKGFVGEEPEYECFASWGPVIGQTDAAAAIVISNEVDRLGMDCNESGWLMGLIMECYAKGILTKKETDGLEMTWGNVEAVRAMLRKIAYRQGFGDVLAEGVMRAAQRIGGEAPQFAIHTMKGNTPRGHDHRVNWTMLFDTCVSQMSTDEGHSVLRPEDLGLERLTTPFSPEEVAKSNAQTKGAVQFEDTLGTCRFTTRTDLKLLAEALEAATGWEFSVNETMEVGKRIVNLLRAFNMRHGHTAEMDAPSPRYGSAPPDGPAKGVTIVPDWEKMRSIYYEQMGWDKETGKPLPETLARLGLEHVIPDLW